MKVDVARAIGAVTREVRSGERDGHPTRTVVAVRSYSTSIADLWDAITNEERIPRWFAPVAGDLRLGGRYQIKGNAAGLITACEPPRLVAMTWEFGGAVSWVTVVLEPNGTDETLLTLEHEAPVDPHWRKFGPGAVGVGWELSLTGLDLHVAGGATVSHAEFETWSVTQEGKAFARASAQGWGLAAIASGEERSEADAAAERTRAFYSGEPVRED